MKPTIILINRKHQTKELNILRKLLSKILHDFSESDASIYPNELIKDFIGIAQLKDCKIGLYENNSTNVGFSHELDFFAYKSCDLIFCHTKMTKSLNEKLKSLEKGDHIHLIHLKRIWLDTIPIKSLEDYEVDKLMDIILMRTESNNEFPINQSNINKAQTG